MGLKLFMKAKKGSKRSAASKKTKRVEQPQPFTPGMTKGMVRQHAYELYRDKLAHDSLTLQDWVLAEKDLVAMQERGEMLER